MTQEKPRLAVLIDADNVSPGIADRLFEKIAELGEANIRRLYGDFSGTKLKGWMSVAERHAINVRQQYAHVTGKNATDIALVIEAMDLLHSGLVDGFCIVSSDSDFNSLAIRIRERGMPVYGFGHMQTPLGFRQSCKQFFMMSGWDEKRAPQAVLAKVVEMPLSPTAVVLTLIRKALAGQEDAEGWVTLSTIGTRMRQLDPSVDTRGKLGKLVRKADVFDFDDKGSGSRIRARRKS